MRQHPGQIIPEDALVDYLGCPLRYALLWYYDVDIHETQSGYREGTRSGLSGLFKLLHERTLSNLSLQEELDAAGLDEATQMFVWPALLKYAADIRGRRVLGYQIPARRRIGRFTFVTSADALCMEDKRLILLKFVAVPWIFDLALESLVMGLVQLCLPQNVRREAARRGLKIEWRTIKIRGPRVIETEVQEQKHTDSTIVSVARGLAAHSFYPRWPKSLCRRCGFQSICSPKWCAGRAFRKRTSTRAQIIEELSRAGIEARNP